ncbi:hypothetical protein PIB30_009915 [Stylosanthes scabra]|uniref:Uncharacterized protein n=1 Tax=Stylosanthes scabra TaxID=79078 RepID=A0ABU6S5K3_9FABA|nr:hypothetical protein [Stylosanthes scabra]
MASSSPFRSLDHAIDVAKDIFLNKLDVGSWLEALSYLDCFSTYITTATKSTEQNTKGSSGMPLSLVHLEKALMKFLVRYTNMHLVELDIAYREEMKLIELHLTNYYVDLYFDSVEVNSLGTDHATEFDTNNDPPENVRGVDRNQSKAEEHVRPKRGFDLNK